MRIFLSKVLVLAVALGCSAALAQTDNYPSRSVRIIAGSGSGSSDITNRLFAAQLTKRLGQPFLVEVRTGAANSIAGAAVKNAPADGYTLFGGSVTGFHPLNLKENSMDASKELQPVSTLAIGELFLMVRSELGVSSLKEFAAKAKATRLRNASSSPNTHAQMMVVAKHMGFEYDNIPYKDGDWASRAVLSGESDFTVNALAGRLGFIQQGKFRVLATFGAQRSGLLPNVPTAKEQGVDFANNFDFSVWAPLGTPRPIVDKLAAAIAQAVKDPEVIEKMHAVALNPFATTPEELSRLYQSTMATLKVANDLAGLKPQ